MEYDNTAIILMVIVVVACVLALTFSAVYYLNRIVDRNVREGDSGREA